MSSGSRGLRALLERQGGQRWPLRQLDADFVPRKVRAVSAEMLRRYTDIDQRLPETAELDAVRLQVLQAWALQGNLAQFPRRLLRRLPMVLFHPANRPEEWIGSDERFSTAYADWLERESRATTRIMLLRAYLMAYPETASVQRIWGECLARLFKPLMGERIDVWRRRAEYFAYFHNYGAVTTARLWFDESCDFDTFLNNSGLTGALEASRFLREVQLETLAFLRRALQGDSISREGLLRTLRLYLGRDGKLSANPVRFRLGDSLLEPFATRKGQEDVTQFLRDFMLAHFGDPRVSQSQWSGFSKTSRDVMLRWLVAVALEDFFRLLDRTALEYHWRYRKAFWSAYLERGHITDAWVALGSTAVRVAQGLTSGRQGANATLSGAESTHAVLIMKIDTLTVAEWSHNGSCRFWRSTNQRAPQLYRPAYRRYELMAGADGAVSHNGSERGSWQAEIERWIRDETGIRVPSSEYMPRKA